MGLRPKPYTLEGSEESANVDEMFEILFSDISLGAVFPEDMDLVAGDVLYYDGTELVRLGIGAANTIFRTDGVIPEWDKLVLTTDVTGILPVANGGTAIASYAIGDLLYASAAAVLSKLADVSAGSYLRSGGVTTAPLWSTLKLPNAGTVGDIPIVTTADTVTMLTAGTATHVLTSNGAGVAPSWQAAAAAGTGITGLLTNGDGTNPELIFDSNGDVITVT